jgi:chromosomal replication initiator protein
VVLSADRAPNEINLHERYLSRFNSGVIADVQPPSFETKLIIFNNYLKFCCTQRFDCPETYSLIRPEIAEYIVSLSGNNIRELEGATTNLVFMLCQEKNRYLPLTKEEADMIVSKHFRRIESHSINISTILKETEDFYNVKHEDILSKRRSQDISYPRQVAMYLCRMLIPDASYPIISNAFGGKDHTSAMYAYNNIEKKRHLSQHTDQEIKKLTEIITG